MGMSPNEKNKILKVLPGVSESDKLLSKEDLESFSKTLLNFFKNSDNYNSQSKRCRVASLTDLKADSILRLSSDDDRQNIVNIKRKD